MADWTHITVFTDEYPADKQAEGIAVQRCVAEGLCDKCMHLPVCSADEHFVPPSGAICMDLKRKILGGGGK